MRIRGLGTARRIAGWARSRVQGGPLILGYHRVADSDWDPQKLCVSPDNFRQQLGVLTRAAQPVKLDELSASLRDGKRPAPSFVVTIDDGYEDTLTHALPILEDHRVPATVFVTTGILAQPFWWCEIQKLVEDSAELPPRINLRFDERDYEWVRGSGSLSNRTGLVRFLGDAFRATPFEQHGRLLDTVKASFDPSISESGVLAMTAEQVAELSRSELIEVGSHCVTHTSLNQLCVDDQRRELRRSKEELESVCGRPVISCSYPNGRIGKETPAIAREAGYSSACASHEELVPPGCDPMQLPRVWVGDLDEQRFARWLKWWLG